MALEMHEKPPIRDQETPGKPRPLILVSLEHILVMLWHGNHVLGVSGRLLSVLGGPDLLDLLDLLAL